MTETVTDADAGQAAGFDPALLDPPWPFREQPRERPPVFKLNGLGLYVAIKYDDAVRLLKGPHAFSSSFRDEAKHRPNLVRRMLETLPIAVSE
jgi:hypothetical protein